MKDKNTPFSSRIYPKRKCPQCNEDFSPHDGRQKYCCRQHQIDFNNDKLKAKNKSDKKLIQGIKSNYDILKKVYASKLYMDHKKIMRDVLDYENYDYTQYHRKVVNKQTNNEILILYDYGLECINLQRGEFVIHQFNNNKN
jgi:hypothetical protein